MQHSKLVVVAALLTGCFHSSDGEGPTTRSSAQSTTRPTLRPIDLREGIYLARVEIHTTITSDGLLRTVRTENKSYGPNDLDRKNERVEIREGQLTPEQMAALTALFANWDSLSSEPYGGVADGGEIKLRYGNKSVCGGSATPKQVWDVQSRISAFTATMRVIRP